MAQSVKNDEAGLNFFQEKDVWVCRYGPEIPQFLNLASKS